MNTARPNPLPAPTRAFTLIEVMVATTVFFMAMFAILGVMSSGLHSAMILRSNGPTAGMIASEFLVTNTIEEKGYSGDFSDIAGYDKYTWRASAVEVATNGLFKMDIVVNDPNGNMSSQVTVLLFKAVSGNGERLGLHP